MPENHKNKGEVVKEFCEDTSTVGAIFWWKSWPSCWSLLWAIALLAAWGVSTFQVYVIFAKYFQYTTTVSVKVEHSENATLPAVTICNNNPIRYNYYKKNEEKFPSLKQIMSIMEVIKNSSSPGREQALKIIGQMTSDNVNDMVQYLIYSTKVDVKTAGHQLEEMLVECNFQGILCNASDFFRWQDPSYGNCYTLAYDSEKFSSFIGPRYGLKLILYTQNSEYIPLATSDIGFRVQLHPVEYVPFPRDHGFSIAPGYVTSVAIKELQMIRQGLPYDGTDCGQELERTSLFDYWSKVTAKKRGKASANYSSNACVKHCYLESVRETCKCYDPSMITYDYASMYAKIRGIQVPDACDITKTNDCLNEIAAQINRGSGNCVENCNQACFELAFVPRITSSLWPNKDYFQAMINVWEKRLPDGIMDVKNQEDALIALAKLEVYFEDLNYESISESPAMDVWDLLTNIGGIFGLYTGVCFLTAVEYLHLACRLLRA